MRFVNASTLFLFVWFLHLTVQARVQGPGPGPGTVRGSFATKFASELGFSMIGSIISQKGNNVVLIKYRDSGKVVASRVGTPILDDYVVMEIKPDYLVLANMKTPESGSLKIYKDGFVGSAPKPVAVAPAPQAVGITDSYKEEGFAREKNEIQLTQAYREKKIMEELPKILMQASAEPVMRNGEIVGFSLDQIDQESIFAKAGLVNGDIVKSINDIALNDVTATIKMLHSLKKSTEIHFVMERGGQDVPVQISVK